MATICTASWLLKPRFPTAFRSSAGQNEQELRINQAVRARLVAAGHVQTLGQKHQILIPRDMTDPQKRDARSYHEGEVIYFRRGSKAQQIPKRAYLTVATVNDEALTLRAENGRLIQFDPSRWKGINVFTAEERTIAVGDRLEWRERDSKRGIANHRYGTITRLDARQIEVRFDNGRKLNAAKRGPQGGPRLLLHFACSPGQHRGSSHRKHRRRAQRGNRK